MNVGWLFAAKDFCTVFLISGLHYTELCTVQDIPLLLIRKTSQYVGLAAEGKNP